MNKRLGIGAAVIAVVIAVVLAIALGQSSESHTTVNTSQPANGRVAGGDTVPTAPAPTTAAPKVALPTTVSPQANGGDQDPDNNGKASDGDGDI